MTRDERLAAIDAANPAVRALFEQFAFDRIARGLPHYSADALMHRIRWHTEEAHGVGAYKINNNLSSYFARKFHAAHPEHANFFQTRRLKRSQ